jgi:hypothetical protein
MGELAFFQEIMIETKILKEHVRHNFSQIGFGLNTLIVHSHDFKDLHTLGLYL